MVHIYETTFPSYFDLISNKFNREFKEVKGFTSRIDEGKNIAKVFVNALGVNKDDIEILWKDGYKNGTVDFTVKGKTVVDEELKPFEFEVVFTSPHPVKKISKKVENGLVILTLHFDKPAQPDILIEEE